MNINIIASLLLQQFFNASLHSAASNFKFVYLKLSAKNFDLNKPSQMQILNVSSSERASARTRSSSHNDSINVTGLSYQDDLKERIKYFTDEFVEYIKEELENSILEGFKKGKSLYEQTVCQTSMGFKGYREIRSYRSDFYKQFKMLIFNVKPMVPHDLLLKINKLERTLVTERDIEYENQVDLVLKEFVTNIEYNYKVQMELSFRSMVHSLIIKDIEAITTYLRGKKMAERIPMLQSALFSLKGSSKLSNSFNAKEKMAINKEVDKITDKFKDCASSKHINWDKYGMLKSAKTRICLIKYAENHEHSQQADAEMDHIYLVN